MPRQKQQLHAARESNFEEVIYMTRLPWKASFIAASVVPILVLMIAGGFAFWSRNIPEIASLTDFAPDSPRQISDEACLSGSVTVIPYSQIPTLLRQAVSTENRSAIIPLHISRSLFCNSHDRLLERELKEMFIAKELEHRFSREQLFTIYMNRVCFGESTMGVQSAAQRYFGKDAAALTLPQAALLAGMIRNPHLYSPDKHPGQALQRRNEILDAMFQQGNVSAADLQAAKGEPLR